MRREAEEEERNYIWSRDLDKHYYGDLSFAIVQANQTLEDYSQYDTGKDVLFAGVYDGHGGAEAANFISIHLLRHIASECSSSFHTFFIFFSVMSDHLPNVASCSLINHGGPTRALGLDFVFLFIINCLELTLLIVYCYTNVRVRM